MKKLLLAALLILLFSGGSSYAQWCTPTTAIPYNANMPGITHVVFNTIDRTSADVENYPGNSYVLTGLSTDVSKGGTYDFEISYTIDASICPDMNIRVWIDFNHDGQLDDVGETVISEDHKSPGTYTGSITIPTTAMTGMTRMRVTAKMTSNGGHSLPTPCDDPADPLGYHGEFEDYDLNITDATGIDVPQEISGLQIAATPEQVDIKFHAQSNGSLSLDLMSIDGRVVSRNPGNHFITKGDHALNLPLSSALTSGIYFVVVNFNNAKLTRQIIIQ